MFSDTHTTYLDFLPNTNKATTPAGKEILVSDIGANGLRFIAKKPAKWDLFDRYGNRKPSVYSIVGNSTPAIDNAYYSKVYNGVVIEFKVGGDVYKTKLDGENFDLLPLESLTSYGQRVSQAQASSSEANTVIDLKNAGPFDKIMYAMFGVTGKQAVPYLVGGVVSIIVLKNLLKGKK